MFAIPLAVLGALYTSLFIHPTIKAKVKPTVEIMAALPSVVLGFIAGLWLAPTLERVAPGVLLMPVVIPLLTFLAVAGWTAVPVALRRRVPHGTELLVAMVKEREDSERFIFYSPSASSRIASFSM